MWLGLSSYGISSYSSLLCIMEWDIIYIKDQNCQKRALIIENLTESKEQLFTLPSLLSAQTESHLVAVNTIISFIFKKRKKLKTLQAVWNENMLDTKATASTVFTWGWNTSQPYLSGCRCEEYASHWPVLRGLRLTLPKTKQTEHFSERTALLMSCTTRLNIFF